MSFTKIWVLCAFYFALILQLHRRRVLHSQSPEFITHQQVEAILGQCWCRFRLKLAAMRMETKRLPVESFSIPDTNGLWSVPTNFWTIQEHSVHHQDGRKDSSCSNMSFPVSLVLRSVLCPAWSRAFKSFQIFLWLPVVVVVVFERSSWIKPWAWWWLFQHTSTRTRTRMFAWHATIWKNENFWIWRHTNEQRTAVNEFIEFEMNVLLRLSCGWDEGYCARANWWWWSAWLANWATT